MLLHAATAPEVRRQQEPEHWCHAGALAGGDHEWSPNKAVQPTGLSFQLRITEERPLQGSLAWKRRKYTGETQTRAKRLEQAAEAAAAARSAPLNFSEQRKKRKKKGLLSICSMVEASLSGKRLCGDQDRRHCVIFLLRWWTDPRPIWFVRNGRAKETYTRPSLQDKQCWAIQPQANAPLTAWWSPKPAHENGLQHCKCRPTILHPPVCPAFSFFICNPCNETPQDMAYLTPS